MSRIGKKPVAIPGGVTATIDNGTLSVKGPKGTLTLGLSDLIEYKVEEGEISVKPANDSRQARAFWGMQRTLVSNLVEGVTDGFTKILDIKGVGYRANAQGKTLKLQLGYSHDVDLTVPEGLEVKRLLVAEAVDKLEFKRLAAGEDAYYSVEPGVAQDETAEAFGRLVAAGKVRAFEAAKAA